MFSKIIGLAVAAALAMSGLAAATASATTVEANGSALASGAHVYGDSASAGSAGVLTTSVGNITCDVTFDGTLGTNPSSPSVTASVSGPVWSNCSDTILFITVQSVTTTNTPTATITAGTTPSVDLNQVNVDVDLGGGNHCYFNSASPVNGSGDNSTSILSYSSIGATLQSGSFWACPGSGSFSVDLYVSTAASGGGDPVTIN